MFSLTPPAGDPPPHSSLKQRRRRQFITISATCLTAVVLFAGLQGWKRASAATNGDPNRVMATRVLRLGQALDRHASRQERLKNETAYPTTQAFPAFVSSLPDGDKLLASPWGGSTQLAVASAGGKSGLPTAVEHLDGAPAPTLRLPLGAGAAPGATGFTAHTFGALVYDHDPVSDSYVLYGVGEVDGSAVIVAETDSDLMIGRLH